MELAKKGIRTAVITNDQGMKLVDSAFFRKRKIPLRQVINGCFCCNFSKLEYSIISLLETERPDEIFAESVGSCTDIVATVIRPLMDHDPGAAISFSVFADARLLYLFLSGNPDFFQENVKYIYSKQLEESTLLVVNKIDLVSPGLLAGLKKFLQEKYPGKVFLFQNSLDEISVAKWMQTIQEPGSTLGLPQMEVDYDTYAAGEASLAWLDQELEFYSPVRRAANEAIRFVNALYNRIRQSRYPIGHLKFILDDDIKISFASTSDQEVSEDLVRKNSEFSRLLINARVQTDPDSLSLVVSEVIREMEPNAHIKITNLGSNAFKPAYPSPEFRIPS